MFPLVCLAALLQLSFSALAAPPPSRLPNVGTLFSNSANLTLPTNLTLSDNGKPTLVRSRDSENKTVV